MTTVGIILCYAILWYSLGQSVQSRLWPERTRTLHPYFFIGANFIVGMIMFASVWLCLAHTSGRAKLGLFLTTIAALVLVAYRYRSIVTSGVSRVHVVRVLIVLSIVGVVTIGRALLPMPAYFVTHPELTSPFFGFGAVGHSFRAGNLANYMVSENTLPVLNQHSGQALIASIPLFLGQPSAQLSLVVWLAVFIGLFIITTYGYARTCINNRFLAIIPVGTVFLGNTVLSPFYASVTDTDNALLFSSNIESVVGIFSFMVIVILLYERRSDRTLGFATAALLLATAFVWNVTSGQMIILLLLLLSGAVAISLYRRVPVRFLITGIVCLIVGGGVGALTVGGMFSLQASHLALPGLMTVKNEAYPALALRFPRTGEGNPDTLQKLSTLSTILFTPASEQAAPTVNQAAPTGAAVKESIKENQLLFAVAKLGRSVQLVIFPLLGIALAVFLLRRLPTYITERTHFATLTFATSLLFTAGWVASSVFTVYGYYFELSKFLSIGVFLAMFLLGVSLTFVITSATTRTIKTLAIAVIAFVLCGPTLELGVVKLIGNFYFSPQTWTYVEDKLPPESFRSLTMPERLDFLLHGDAVYGTKL